jgi:hypothetical protein
LRARLGLLAFLVAGSAFAAPPATTTPPAGAQTSGTTVKAAGEKTLDIKAAAKPGKKGPSTAQGGAASGLKGSGGRPTFGPKIPDALKK